MIAAGDLVLLRAEGGREYLATVKDEKLQTDLGIVDLRCAEGLEWGSSIASHLGKPFTVLRPRAPDLFRHLSRTGAPMMPKDIGAIIAYTGLCPSDIVLDAGTGSGVLAIYLGLIAKRVVSYEVNEHFVSVARKNVALAGLSNVEVRHGDIIEELGRLEGPFDIVTLDMQGAPSAVEGAYRLLAPGGFLASYSPFFEQAMETRRAVERANFFSYNTLMFGEQELEVGRRGTRPSTRVGHTGFITIARK